MTNLTQKTEKIKALIQEKCRVVLIGEDIARQTEGYNWLDRPLGSRENTVYGFEWEGLKEIIALVEKEAGEEEYNRGFVAGVQNQQKITEKEVSTSREWEIDKAVIEELTHWANFFKDPDMNAMTPSERLTQRIEKLSLKPSEGGTE